MCFRHGDRSGECPVVADIGGSFEENEDVGADEQEQAEEHEETQ